MMNIKKCISDNLQFDNIIQYLPELPSPKQREFLRYGCLEGLYGGSTGGGKSSALLMGAVQGISVPGYSALLLRRTYQDLAKPGALMDRAHQWWDKTDARWDEKNKIWKFPTGARISFGYMDGPRDHTQYQSAEYHYVGFDEASQFEERQVMYLHSRLRSSNDWPTWLKTRLRMATNPGGIGHEWIKKRYQIPDEGTHQILEQYKNGKLLRVFVPSMATDNPHINVAEYLAGLDELDPITRAQLRDGKWYVDSSGLVYYCYQEGCNIDFLPKHIPAAEWKYVLGTDYASTNDATAFAVCAYSSYEPEVICCWTEEHKGMSPTDAAHRISELTEQFGRFESIVGDSGGLGAAYVLEMTKHFAIPISPAEKQHKLAYIRLLNGELANNRLKIVSPYCSTWINQAKNLLWSDGTRTKENQSQHNDSCDALLYCWRECRHYSTVTRPKKKMIVVDEFEAAAEAKALERQAEYMPNELDDSMLGILDPWREDRW